VTFLLDENIPEMVARALRALELPFTHALDHFQRGTKDEVLFERLRERGWILVTRDARMWRNKPQRQALLDAGLGVFIHRSETIVTAPAITSTLINRYGEMVAIATQTKLPFVMKIPDKGKIQPF
jgi:hypothetical protein